MSNLKKVFVDCVHDGRVIASYQFGYGETTAPTAPPTHQSLVAKAKTNLTNERLAFPPYDGIEFKVRR